MSPRHSPRFRNRPLQRLVKLLNSDFGNSVCLRLGLMLLGTVDLIFLGIVHLEEMYRNSQVWRNNSGSKEKRGNFPLLEWSEFHWHLKGEPNLTSGGNRLPDYDREFLGNALGNTNTSRLSTLVSVRPSDWLTLDSYQLSGGGYYPLDETTPHISLGRNSKGDGRYKTRHEVNHNRKCFGRFITVISI